MVRFSSAGVQGARRSVDVNGDLEFALEDDTMTSLSPRFKSAALTPDGHLLVFAPPLIMGFIGAPLALAGMVGKRRGKVASRKNWAKRRAYAG
jgi:hypothetical protein